MSLSSRDRVLCAINHEEPDRVPLFVGTSGVTSVLGPGYPRLRAHLKLPATPTRYISRPFQYVLMDDDLLERLGSDGRSVMPGPAPSGLARDISENCLVDSWGCVWQKREDTFYFEITNPPLQNATVDELDRYPWPDLAHPSRFAGLADRCRNIQQSGYATALMTGVTLFEQACTLRGIENCLMDLAADPDFYLALQDRIRKLTIPYLEQLFRQAGPCVDIAVMADDMGSQQAPLMSPDVYRRLIKPCQAEVIAAIRKYSKAKVFLHSCGNIYPLIRDLVEIGVDILNPIQVAAGEMGDTARLKREFGGRLSFCGAIDTSRVLPRGTTADVRREVRRRIGDLGPGGGYIAAAVHCIQPDVPPVNIAAMCEETTVAGKYPLKL